MTDMMPVSLTNATPLATPPPAAGASDSGRFGQTLGAFLDAQGDPGVPSAPAAPPDEDRQEMAADGKALPGGAPYDVDPSGQIIPWSILVVPHLPTPIVSAGGAVPPPEGKVTDVAQPGAAPGAAPVADAIADPLPPAAVATPVHPVLLLDAVARTPSLRIPDPAVAATPSPVVTLSQTVAAKLAAPGSDAPTTLTGAAADLPSKWSDIAVRRGLTDDAAPATPLVAPRADPAIAVSSTPQPARTVFAAAIAAASGWRERLTKSGAIETPITAPATALDTIDRTVVAATGEANHAPLDLTRDTGLQGMIDRIETLRDGADAADTRIRLTPDALGGVDIAVRTSGDQVHVHFTAEREATQALLADAQPRLTELAANRGLRLDASVSTGSGGAQHGQGGNANPQPRAPVAPRPAIATPETPDQPGEQRLA